MKKILIIIGLFFICCDLFSQIKNYSGYVIDDNNKNISYVHIYFKNAKIGTVTDSVGYFSIDEKLLKNNFKDTIIFSCIGYEKKEIPISTFINYNRHSNVIIKQNTIFLEEILIKPRESTIYKFGYDNLKSSMLTIYGRPGKCLIVKIKNEENKKNGIIKSISFQVKNNNSMINNRLRVRFFYQENEKFIFFDYFKEEQIIISDFSKKRITIDISKYNIPFPQEGVYVGLEWIEPEGVFNKLNVEYYPGIKCTSKLENNLTWVFDSYDMKSTIFPSLSEEEKENLPKVFLNMVMKSNAKIGISVIY